MHTAHHPTQEPAPIALLVDAMHPRARRAEHPLALAAALERLGYAARVEPVAAGVLGRASTHPLCTAHHPVALLAYDPFSPAAWLGARIARQRGIPLLLIEPGWTGERRVHERLLGELGNRLWGRSVRANAGRLVALDPLGQERALLRGFSPGRVAVVPPGVDTDFYRPGQPSRLVGRHRLHGRLLLSAGPLEAGRGLELLLAAFARSVGQRPDWSLVFVGEGSLARRLRAAADRMGVGALVHILPWPSPEDLAGLLAAGTLFAAPDEGDQAGGTQVVRAMASGLGVLVSERPRLGHLVRDGEHGRVLPAGDLEAWRRALLEAAGAPEKRELWGQRARARAESHFAWEQVARGVLAVLGELGVGGVPQGALESAPKGRITRPWPGATRA